MNWIVTFAARSCVLEGLRPAGRDLEEARIEILRRISEQPTWKRGKQVGQTAVMREKDNRRITDSTQ
jgi:hypothetical protein